MVVKTWILLALVVLALANESKGEEKAAEEVVGVKKQEVQDEAADASKVAAAAEDTKKDKRGLLDLGLGYAAPYAYSNLAIPTVYSQGVHTNTVITKEVPVAVPVEKHVPYPVIQKVAVPVDRPVAIHVPRPYPVEITKHVPVPYDRPVAVPYPVIKHVAVPYAQPVVVEKFGETLPVISAAYTTF